ncbi:MAG: DUF167 domain-containing protein [Promethearchaeota archaeon]|jgi:uncharacterized protein (TIGR00251 family)
MKFIELKANDTYLLRLKVKTNSRKQEIFLFSEKDTWLSVKLKSKPVKNKANSELINLIRKRLDITLAQIHIISGLKNRNKTIEIKFNSNIGKVELIKKLIG